MAEYSYFHNGTARGDAIDAPYAHTLFHTIMQSLYNSDGVIYDADYLTALTVTAGFGDTTISVAAGSAFVQGVYFNNSGAEVLTLDAGPTSGIRFDQIVIRVNWMAQTARLAVVKGAAGTAPAMPVLQQEFGVIWEFPIARVYWPEDTAIILQTSVYDDRLFMPTADTPPIKNIMHNSEFIANADTSYDREAPAYWWSTGGYPIENSGEGLTIQSRGRAIQAVIQDNDTLETDLYACDLSTTYYPDETLLTIAFYIQVDVGGALALDFDGGMPAAYSIIPTEQPFLILHRVNVSSALDTIGFYIEAYRETTFKLFQVTAAFGPNPAPFLPNRETILFGTKVAATGSPFTRSTGSYTLARSLLPLATSLPSESGVYFMQRVGDTTSVGDDVIYAAMGNANNIRTEVGRADNDTIRQHIGLTQAGDANTSIPSVPIEVIASGAGNLTQEIYVIGCEV